MKYTIGILLVITNVAFSAQKVQVTSDSMKAMETKKEIHFIGNAKVSKEKDWIHGDEIIVYFDDQNTTDKYVAKGSVTFELYHKLAIYKGKADKVTYYPKRSEYILTGKAVVDDIVNKRHVNGKEIVLDTKTGNANVKGSQKQPVTFIFDAGKSSE